MPDAPPSIELNPQPELELLTEEHTNECPKCQFFSSESNQIKKKKVVESEAVKNLKAKETIDAVNSDLAILFNVLTKTTSMQLVVKLVD